MDGREDRAWLLRNRFNPFPISGVLSLADDVITFRLDDEAADATLGWLEAELGEDDLKDRIEAGEKIVAFSLSLADVEVSWPITGGPMMLIDSPSRKWVVSYDHPVGGGMLQTLNLISGRGKLLAWKKAIASAERGEGEG